MKNIKLSFKLFEYKKTPVYLNISFFIIFLLFPFITTICILASVILHEMGHVYMSKKLGYNVEKILINIFGGAAIVDESYIDNNKNAIKIAMAGPVVNIILSLISFVFCIIFFKYEYIYDNILTLLTINLILTFTNLIPVFPLDGGRILYHTISIFNSKNSKKISSIISIIISSFFLIYAIHQLYFMLIIFTILFIFLNLMRYKEN
jgi:stage IV sporulation protein FB